MNMPVVLDIDASVGTLPDEHRLSLGQWQEAIRFGCSLPTLRRFGAAFAGCLPMHHGTVLLGSGDFHHLSWPLVERCARGRAPRSLQVVVLDNHPDNMRFPFGVHCGSWVRRVALLPQVAQVQVLGITSGDIGWRHAWENYWAPLRAGRLVYWSTGVDVGWARRLGLGHAFRSFDSADALVDAASQALRASAQPTYLTIDKDVFSPDVVHTNWDQGRFGRGHLQLLLAALHGRVVASDITGEVSTWQYSTAWKRWLSAHDGQDTAATPAALPDWQRRQHAFNLELLAGIAAAAA